MLLRLRRAGRDAVRQWPYRSLALPRRAGDRRLSVPITVIPNGIGELPKPSRRRFSKPSALHPTVFPVGRAHRPAEVPARSDRGVPAGAAEGLEARARGRRRLCERLRSCRRTGCRARRQALSCSATGRPPRWRRFMPMPGRSYCHRATRASQSLSSRRSAYGCPVILSDIPAHREIGCAAKLFPSGRYRRHWRNSSATQFCNPPDRASARRRARPHPAAPRLALDRASHARCLSRRGAARPGARARSRAPQERLIATPTASRRARQETGRWRRGRRRRQPPIAACV